VVTVLAVALAGAAYLLLAARPTTVTPVTTSLQPQH